METETPAAALEREHREIDKAVAAFLRDPAEEQHRSGLKSAMHELRHHIYLEEEFLFPAMRATLAIPTLVMLREHGELWTTMDALDAALAAGDDASVLELSRDLLGRLDRHNSKEEPIFYTQADSVLAESASAELQALLDSGRMPDGWMCERARS
jgi:regulator of cell morphogenesis and NO signaling